MERKLTFSRSAGFTLIELLVAVAGMAVLTLGAVLAAGRGQVSQAGPDMALFKERFEVAQALAIEGRRTGGLAVRNDETQLYWRVGADWETRSDPVPWRDRVEFNGRRPTGVEAGPDIVFLPSGQSTSFTISFDGGTCANDGWTGLRCADD